jgi:predicted transcriptional regulator
VDPITLATGVVALLAPYLARIGGKLAEQVGDDLSQAALEQLQRLYERVKQKVTGDRFAEPSLERLAQKPESQVRQSAFGEVLAELVERDPSFASELASLVNEAKRAVGPVMARIADAGAIAIQGDIHMQGTNVAGRDITITDQHSPLEGSRDHSPSQREGPGE